MQPIDTFVPSGMLFPLEFVFIDFACYDASCRPPTSGGTGGSRSKGKGAYPTSSSDLDLLFPGRRDSGNKTVNPDGTFSVEGLDANGNFTSFKPATEKKIKAAWDAAGPSEDQYVANFVVAGQLAMGIDPKTGAVDAAQAAIGAREAKWYSTAHNDCQKISSDTGIPMDNVVAATTTLSAGRIWSGTKNGNIETARLLADIVANPHEIEVTQAHLDMMAWRLGKSTKGVGKVGLTDHGLKVGKYSTDDLDSGSLVELMYATQTLRGFKSFKEWQAAPTKVRNAANKGTPGPYPIFTSKGTQQVKQAVAVLRQEVTPRQAISGPKYSSFYSNIRNPNADYSSTNDTWHYRIMAGNLPISYTKKGITRTGTIDQLSIKKRSPDGKAMATTQDIFQNGPASKKEGLSSGDGMFRDTTRMSRKALNALKAAHPEQFGSMKLHEFQALIWVHYGGGQKSNKDRLERWDKARAKAKEVGL